MKTTRRFRYEGREHVIELEQPGNGIAVLRAGDRAESFELRTLAPGVVRLTSDARSFVAYAAREGDDALWIHVGGETVRFELDAGSRGRRRRRDGDGGGLVAPMPGRVVRVEATKDAHVAAGAAILILEAMKMEHTLRAPAAGRVKAIHVGEGEMVKAGQVLAELEAEETEVMGVATDPID